jgi:hypothetical protein
VALPCQSHFESRAPLDVRVEYNEDDVRAIQHLIDSCFKLRKYINAAAIGNMHFDIGWVFIETKLDPWIN